METEAAKLLMAGLNQRHRRTCSRAFKRHGGRLLLFWTTTSFYNISFTLFVPRRSQSVFFFFFRFAQAVCLYVLIGWDCFSSCTTGPNFRATFVNFGLRLSTPHCCSSLHLGKFFKRASISLC
ncbi:hypothetical protein DL89DRAFT_176839 [Linderina pennispora]|uniref:Uncharacterized protein n=1 Tax=Linderina pennispora TaxID=61395 RepID=A0A1Y1VT97_9FUNG|nr:uncharacterized protein DL89DRAFT_176839 [Linderina pennispora]ORX64520.1 hypothetical protein DL89DRAFT_176839 [Linderina pennispora]